jgi:hypothetical protein
LEILFACDDYFFLCDIFFQLLYSRALDPVYRLRATFAEVDKLKDGRYQKMWQEMNTATSSEKAYSNLRKEIRSVTPPCIPYLGMYLTDLTFIEVSRQS